MKGKGSSPKRETSAAHFVVSLPLLRISSSALASLFCLFSRLQATYGWRCSTRGLVKRMGVLGTRRYTDACDSIASTNNTEKA
jgi:hypothetical protein